MSGAILGYATQFVFLVVVAIGGVFCGKFLRERKNAKEELEKK